MTAIDQTLPVITVGRIEMHLRGVLPKACCDHMLGFFNRHTVNVINRFANSIVTPAMRLACKCRIVVTEIETRRNAQITRFERLFQLRNNRFGRRRINIALAHHDPAHEFHYDLIALVATRGTHIHHARFTV